MPGSGLEGLSQVMAAVQDLGRRKAGAIQRKAVTAGGQEVLQEMREDAPRDKGVLAKSLGKKIRVYRQSGVTVAIIGPRSDYQRDVTIGKRIRRTITRRPVRYAHLVDKGTFRSRAYPFTEQALAVAKSRALAAMEQKAAEELART